MKSFSLVFVVLLNFVVYGQDFKEILVKSEIQLKNPKSFDRDTSGNFYVSDTGNNRILKTNKDGEILVSTGKFGWKNSQFDFPTEIDISGGLDVFVSDFNNKRIQRFDRNLNFLGVLPGSDESYDFGNIISCVLSAQGDLFFLDSENSLLQKLTQDGKIDKTFANFNQSESAELEKPLKIKVYKSDKAIVLQKNSVLIFDYFGNFLTDFGENFLENPVSLRIVKDEIWILDLGKILVFDFSGRLKAQKEVLANFKEISDFLVFDDKIVFLDAKNSKFLFLENFKMEAQ
ncbi:NHL repeat-containing protein [bacterium]|nr:NHL repeat-containing protein [bacterium]